MNSDVKKFIEKYKDLIEDENFYTLYQKAYKFFKPKYLIQYLTGKLTTVFLEVGIDPLNYLKEVPKFFLGCQSSIKTYSIPGHITSIG